MKIVIKRLELLNFKGIRSLSVDFDEHCQNIMGANETGKSTIFNAFLWLIDGIETAARRLYKEKWVKARGASVAELEGHTTEFFWNDVPMREKDYQEKVNSLVKEDVFKLLTNPLYFNTGLTGYKIPDWQARR